MTTQGVTSFTLAENTPSVQVDDGWIQDILNLGTAATGPLKLRALIRSSSSTNVVPVPDYQQVFQRYLNHGIEASAVLTNDFDRVAGIGAPLTEVFNNPAINDFSNRTADHAGKLYPYGVHNYFIWNEPNNAGHPEALPTQNFAALLYQCYHRTKAIVASANVYMGGIFWPNGIMTPDQATQNVVNYVSGVYNYLRANGGGVPWDAVTVHVHHCNFVEQDIINLRNGVDSIFAVGDRRPVYVGEWGPTHGDANQGGCTLNAFTWIRNHFDAMWFFQHPNRDNGGACVDSDFGTATWSQGASFSITGHCSLWDQLHYLYQFPNP
jgi:hypothetical protein